MNTAVVTTTQADPNSAIAQQLMAALTAELASRYAPESVVGADVTRMPELHNVTQDNAQFVIAALGEKAVGCGAIRPMDDTTTEVKRMYVAPEARGMGIATQILAKLESLAVAAGFSKTVLETGINQPEAIQLYEKAGYEAIPCYGIYAQTPDSRCYEKQLV